MMRFGGGNEPVEHLCNIPVQRLEKRVNFNLWGIYGLVEVPSAESWRCGNLPSRILKQSALSDIEVHEMRLHGAVLAWLEDACERFAPPEELFRRFKHRDYNERGEVNRNGFVVLFEDGYRDFADYCTGRFGYLEAPRKSEFRQVMKKEVVFTSSNHKSKLHGIKLLDRWKN